MVLRVYDERGDTLINQLPRTSIEHLSRHKAYGVARTAQQANGAAPQPAETCPGAPVGSLR
jgi:hypothetical protein